MAEIVNELTSIEQLTERMRTLEHRVAVLENGRAQINLDQPVHIKSANSARPPETWQGFPSLELPNAVTVFGKSVLGIAGAYLLRAIAESGSVPKVPVLVLAIVYAGLWMIWAIRSRAQGFASVTYAITSTLILSPLLWESTVRFEFLSPSVTGAILVAFYVLTLASVWRHKLRLIPWLASIATVATALAILVATHELVPLTATLLALALVTEVGACADRFLGLRAVPAIGAGLAVWLLVYLMTSPNGVPDGYHAVPSAVVAVMWLALLAMYVASIGIRGFLLRYPITGIEIFQGALAIAIAVYAALRGPQTLVVPALGAFLLLLAGGCYWGALSRFSQYAFTRNRRISATWAAFLVVGASFLLFPVVIQIAFLCCAAVAMTVVHNMTGKSSLGLHATLFLAAGSAVSPIWDYVVNAMAGTVPKAPGWGVGLVTISAALCYLIGSKTSESQPMRRALWLLPAALLAFAGTALTVAAIVSIGPDQLGGSASRLSVIRTVVNCMVALLLAFVGHRWMRIELKWLAYSAVAFGTLKLVFEDLRFGNAGSLVISLLFYGLILILLPRLTRRVKGGYAQA